MKGLTRKEVDKAENKDFALGKGPKRPRDAATLLLLDRSGGKPKVLMGKRSLKHAFMPGKFVFPGGRTDPSDSRVPVHQELRDVQMEKLTTRTSKRFTLTRARAIALSAIRETYEEAGIFIGVKNEFSTKLESWKAFEQQGIAPSLEGLRVIARAITPPGRVRRFDTRFLAAWRDDVALELPEGGPTKELEELMWLDFDEALDADIPMITKTILQELQTRLSSDLELNGVSEVPFYRMVRNQFNREVL